MQMWYLHKVSQCNVWLRQLIQMHGSEKLLRRVILPGVGHDGDQRGPELLHLCVAGDRVGVVEPNQVTF